VGKLRRNRAYGWVRAQGAWLDLALDILTWVFLVELVRYLLGYPRPKPPLSGLSCPSTHRWGHECTFPAGHRSPHLCQCGKEWLR
jgi:hypothetical protein